MESREREMVKDSIEEYGEHRKVHARERDERNEREIV